MGRFTAVAEERLRIARDLHDLLGHNLSLIALKSELAGRLLHAAPERAATEIADIESVARTALQEVRDTVASYRRPALASELRGAREILAAAGIAYRMIGDAEAASDLPTGAEAVLSWAVREGVTNVIRHSRARTCFIHLTRTADRAGIEILDDGPGAAERPALGTELLAQPGGGNGLRGLAERVRAAAGVFEAGPREQGGFRLAVSLPLAATRDQRHPSDTPVKVTPIAADTSHAPAEEALP